MLPSQLTSADFRHYPEMGRKFVVSNLPLLSTLPIALLASMLRELISFDWLFPAEQAVLQSQCANLSALPPEKRAAAVAEFAALSIPQPLSDLDWVNKPARFLEELTAYLWSSSQIDAFRTAAVHFAAAVGTNDGEQKPSLPRLCAVVLPGDLDKPGYELFRKLRPHGVFFENIEPGWQENEILQWVQSRAAGAASPLDHFYVDGGTPSAEVKAPLDVVSWHESAAVRQELLRRLERMTHTAGVGPEAARTQLASLTPADVGLQSKGNQAVLDHFVVRVLTEGSGTQIFSTTFVQWTARELLRRAQPSTLLVRFGARDEFRPIEVMLSDSTPKTAPDPQGSFVDADMGAYYTWINQQRLSGADNARFLAFSEARRQAIAIGPGLPRGTFGKEPMSLTKVIALVS